VDGIRGMRVSFSREMVSKRIKEAFLNSFEKEFIPGFKRRRHHE